MRLATARICGHDPAQPGRDRYLPWGFHLSGRGANPMVLAVGILIGIVLVVAAFFALGACLIRRTLNGR